MSGWVMGWMAEWVIVCLVAWMSLGGCDSVLLAGWSVGWVAGRLAGSLGLCMILYFETFTGQSVKIFVLLARSEKVTAYLEVRI